MTSRTMYSFYKQTCDKCGNLFVYKISDYTKPEDMARCTICKNKNRTDGAIPIPPEEYDNIMAVIEIGDEMESKNMYEKFKTDIWA